jgi:predicted 3-demethylubiquinone-9 3-methyltransferase (glyoxalase superfamily)
MEVPVMRQKISPFLWYDKEARDAAMFYTTLFRNSKVLETTTLHDTPSGSVDLVDISLSGQEFGLMSAGPLFKFNPSVSFLAACSTKDEVETLWRDLSKGGKALMELGAYPWSDRYGWTQDRYGLSWQVMHMGARPVVQPIVPTLMFAAGVAGKAEEAIRFYVSVFDDAAIGDILRYGEQDAPNRPGTVKHASFTLEGLHFAAMDSALEHSSTFNEAISFVVRCRTQAEQCGWLKDRYGLSWQIVPTVMDEMMRTKDPKRLARVTQAFLKMKKFDIAALQRAYEG